MYNSNVEKKELIYALFCNITKEKLISEVDTDILGEHYKNFYTLFIKKDSKDIEEYVANNLLNIKYSKKDINYKDSEEIKELSNLITTEISKYKLNMIYEISKLVYKINDYNDFVKIFSYKNLSCLNEFDDEEIESFDEDEEKAQPGTSKIRNICEKIKEELG